MRSVDEDGSFEAPAVLVIAQLWEELVCAGDAPAHVWLHKGCKQKARKEVQEVDTVDKVRTNLSLAYELENLQK
jgi:hypothetical protein